jgi:sensor domain CHASE-containing protein
LLFIIIAVIVVVVVVVIAHSRVTDEFKKESVSAF